MAMLNNQMVNYKSSILGCPIYGTSHVRNLDLKNEVPDLALVIDDFHVQEH